MMILSFTVTSHIYEKAYQPTVLAESCLDMVGSDMRKKRTGEGGSSPTHVERWGKQARSASPLPVEELRDKEARHRPQSRSPVRVMRWVSPEHVQISTYQAQRRFEWQSIVGRA